MCSVRVPPANQPQEGEKKGCLKPLGLVAIWIIFRSLCVPRHSQSSLVLLNLIHVLSGEAGEWELYGGADVLTLLLHVLLESSQQQNSSLCAGIGCGVSCLSCPLLICVLARGMVSWYAAKVVHRTGQAVLVAGSAPLTLVGWGLAFSI
eukprot:1159730-Pelagomonas_calceolata.AAC.7